ncbi:MAG: phosphatidylserine decarboxylase [Treponema sp.]|nr:phosphatidylserine decarboxylase [Treponema sp.]
MGRMFLNILVRPFVSVFFGLIMDGSFSRLFIKGFIKRNNIDMNEYEDVKYSSFNDFFSREAKKENRHFTDNKNDLISPCDSKLTVYQIDTESIFQIKNSAYDVESLLNNKQLADEFTDGVCLIFRLTPSDYHRYCYIDDGEILSVQKIKGKLHTVRPISLQRYNIYKLNSREYTVMQTANFGKIIQMEVGALFVGRIKNQTASGFFERRKEKGMFEFGGSTIVILLQKDKIAIDETIWNNTRLDKETVVKMGYKIGVKL